MPYPVRYAKTDDGVNIAFTWHGQGEAIIYVMALPWSNFAVGYGNAYSARHAEELATFSRVVTYDPRGCGLSDHDADDLSLDGFAKDIDAVAQAAGLDTFMLYGSADASPSRFATQQPARTGFSGSSCGCLP